MQLPIESLCATVLLWLIVLTSMVNEDDIICFTSSASLVSLICMPFTGIAHCFQGYPFAMHPTCKLKHDSTIIRTEVGKKLTGDLRLRIL